jgi:hypothetical protein
MKEIRIVRQAVDMPGESSAPGVWVADSPAQRHALAVLVRAGNERFGAGTHWLDTREVGEEADQGSTADMNCG